MRRARRTDGAALIRLADGLEASLANLIAGLGLIAFGLVLFALSLTIGSTAIGLGDLARALAGGPIAADLSYALSEVRLPRALTGFLAGWCVAMTGAMLQSLTRNPLADPGLLGLSQGAMVMIMLVLVFAPGAPTALIPLVALTGGLAVALLLSLLLRGQGGAGPAMLLMGIAVETVLSSVGSILILYAPTDTSYALSSWMAGSLFGAGWEEVRAMLPWALLSLPLLVVAGPILRTLELGEELAMGLGVSLARARPLILTGAVLLTATAVTTVGPLAFLGVMAPHLAQFLSPSSGRAKLILSGLMGGVLVLAADCITRGATADIALPIGLTLSFIGVPLFILTLRLRALRLHRIDERT